MYMLQLNSHILKMKQATLSIDEVKKVLEHPADGTVVDYQINPPSHGLLHSGSFPVLAF